MTDAVTTNARDAGKMANAMEELNKKGATVLLDPKQDGDHK